MASGKLLTATSTASAVGLLLWSCFTPLDKASARPATEKAIVHDVFFTLKESNEQSRKQLVEACRKHLTKHEGELYFAVGVVSDRLKRPVNDVDWDVGLHIVFKDLAAHDKYQDSERHQKFVAEIRGSISKVRVFDTEAE